MLALAATASLVASLIPAPALATATQQPASDANPVAGEVGGGQPPAQAGDEAKGTAQQAVAQTNDVGEETPKASDAKAEAPSDAAGAGQGASQTSEVGAEEPSDEAGTEQDAAQAEGAAQLSAQAEAPTKYTEVTEGTHEMTNGSYRVTRNVTIAPPARGRNGICIRRGHNVLLYIDEGATLTVTGADGQSIFEGGAAILLPHNSTLTIAGKGTLNATGGKGGTGKDGGDAQPSVDTRSGTSGWGGNGAGGAGAGIGTNGGKCGGSGYEWSDGGDAVEGVSASSETKSNAYGNSGQSGTAGTTAAMAGKLIITGSVTVNARGGAAGEGGKGGGRSRYAEQRNTWNAHAAGTSGGGGGGGCGGTSGGGGSGASANIDGESAFFKACDLDDLWGHGGHGGASWGGSGGSTGDEGASNGGDSTGASTKYAKSGGSGGSCAPPPAVPFYVQSDGSSAGPNVTCTRGNGSTREATVLEGLKKQSDAPDAIGAQAETGSWTETVDGAEVTYDWSFACYDESGAEVDADSESELEPGRYTTEISLRVLDAGGKEVWSGKWSTPYVVKRRVEAPTPADLTFQCADLTTGEGTTQDAFPNLDDAIEFVEGATADEDPPAPGPRRTSARTAPASG